MIDFVDQNSENHAAVDKPSLSFPKLNHLTLKHEFTLVFSEGKYQRGKFISVLAYKNPQEAAFKAGFVVKKKMYKRAVDRNRIKRRLREIVRLAMPELEDGVWLVLMAGPSTLKAPWESLNQDFEEICQNLQILKNTAG